MRGAMLLASCGAQSSPPRVIGSKIAGSRFGTVPLSFWGARASGRHIDADEARACNRFGDEAQGARLVDDAVDKCKASRFSLRHDHGLFDAVEVVRDEPQAGAFLRRFMQAHAIAR